MPPNLFFALVLPALCGLAYLAACWLACEDDEDGDDEEAFWWRVTRE